MKLETAFVWLHVVGNVFWIGSIVAVGMLLLAEAADPKTRGELARGLYLRIAVPAFAVSLTAGLTRLLMDTSYYFTEHHWMHGKLAFALGVIALHHVIGARAKKLAAG